jgi:hypothetical protein
VISFDSSSNTPFQHNADFWEASDAVYDGRLFSFFFLEARTTSKPFKAHFLCLHTSQRLHSSLTGFQSANDREADERRDGVGYL